MTLSSWKSHKNTVVYYFWQSATAVFWGHDYHKIVIYMIVAWHNMFCNVIMLSSQASTPNAIQARAVVKCGIVEYSFGMKIGLGLELG